MTKPSSNLRLFVAIYPPEDVVRALASAVRQLKNVPDHRMIPMDQVHLTVQFIGDVPTGDLDRVIESVECSVKGVNRFAIEIRTLITLPDRGHARLIAAEANAHPLLLEIKRRLVSRFARNRRKDSADRFRPHMTLCRFRSPARFAIEQPECEIVSFDVAELQLMRSRLTHGGAIHHVAANASLHSVKKTGARGPSS